MIALIEQLTKLRKSLSAPWLNQAGERSPSLVLAGSAMDLVSGAKRVIVAMQHAAKGKLKIVARCSLPLTSARPVDMVVTDMAVIPIPPAGPR